MSSLTQKKQSSDLQAPRRLFRRTIHPGRRRKPRLRGRGVRRRPLDRFSDQPGDASDPRAHRRARLALDDIRKAPSGHDRSLEQREEAAARRQVLRDPVQAAVLFPCGIRHGASRARRSGEQVELGPDHLHPGRASRAPHEEPFRPRSGRLIDRRALQGRTPRPAFSLDRFRFDTSRTER